MEKHAYYRNDYARHIGSYEIYPLVYWTFDFVGSDDLFWMEHSEYFGKFFIGIDYISLNLLNAIVFILYL